MDRFQTITMCVLVAVCIALCSQAVWSQELAPVPAEWKEAFGAMRPDPHPKEITKNTHYFVTDEKRHDLFREAISNKGGVFIGLGTDQNYLMAGWARPEVLVPLDFDEKVVMLHYAFRVAFLNAETPEAFISMWSKKSAENTRLLIRETYPDEEFGKKVARAYRAARRFVFRRLRRARDDFAGLDVPTYLSDPEQYRFVVDLFRTGRVFPVRGDLTAETTVGDVASAAKKVGLRIGTLYLSNAEQYFKYTDQYRENMRALPFDENTVVIRTVARKKEWAIDGVYQYIVQDGFNFWEWMKSPKVGSVWRINAARKLDRKTGGSVVDTLPPGD